MRQATSVILTNVVENDLLSACRIRLPYETCGIIYGTESDYGESVTITGYSLIQNSSSSPEDTFVFHPEEWVSAYFHAQKNQRQIVGFFHTHPKGSRLPSLKDEKGWIPWGTYWIVSLSEGNGEIAVYRRSPESDWVRLPINRKL